MSFQLTLLYKVYYYVIMTTCLTLLQPCNSVKAWIFWISSALQVIRNEAYETLTAKCSLPIPSSFCALEFCVNIIFFNFSYCYAELRFLLIKTFFQLRSTITSSPPIPSSFCIIPEFCVTNNCSLILLLRRLKISANKNLFQLQITNTFTAKLLCSWILC
jgi:hypothetical protein